MTLASVFSPMGQTNSNYPAGLFYSTKCNERDCMGDKAEMLSCPPQTSMGFLGEHHWVCGLQEVAVGAGCQAWPLLGCFTLAGMSFPSCCRASLWHG